MAPGGSRGENKKTIDKAEEKTVGLVENMKLRPIKLQPSSNVFDQKNVSIVNGIQL